MTIRLDGFPQIDGSGVKRWDYLICGDTLSVFEQPSEETEKRFMLRLVRGAETIATSYASTKVGAAQLATWIQRDAEKGRDDPPYQVVVRATHERGIRQALALDAIRARGLWLTADQKRRAGIAA